VHCSQASSHLIDLLRSAVLLSWPDDDSPKHQFARVVAKRLLDIKSRSARQIDGMGHFSEPMPGLGSYLLSAGHGSLRQAAGSSKLKNFVLMECTNMIIYHNDACGSAGAVELDVYGLLVQVSGSRSPNVL